MEIQLSEDQAYQSSFPPNCPVYIIDTTDEECPPGIDAQGVVESVVLLRGGAAGGGASFEEHFKVAVKCKDDHGNFYCKVDTYGHSNLRYKNGCTVYFLNSNNTYGHNNDENYAHCAPDANFANYGNFTSVQKEGIIMGFCDMPEEVEEDGQKARGREKQKKFWYCVQEVQEKRRIYHHILPEQVSYRHNTKYYEEAVTDTSTHYDTNSKVIFNNPNSNHAHENHKIISKNNDRFENNGTLVSGSENDTVIDFESIDDGDLGNSSSPTQHQLGISIKKQQYHHTDDNPNHKFTNHIKKEKIITKLSSSTHIEWDEDVGTMVKQKYSTSGKSSPSRRQMSRINSCDEKSDHVKTKHGLPTHHIDDLQGSNKENHRVTKSHIKCRLGLPLGSKTIHDILFGRKSEDYEMVKRKLKCKTLQINSETEYGSDSFIDLTAQSHMIANNAMSYLLDLLKYRLENRRTIHHISTKNFVFSKSKSSSPSSDRVNEEVKRNHNDKDAIGDDKSNNLKFRNNMKIPTVKINSPIPSREKLNNTPYELPTKCHQEAARGTKRREDDGASSKNDEHHQEKRQKVRTKRNSETHIMSKKEIFSCDLSLPIFMRTDGLGRLIGDYGVVHKSIIKESRCNRISINENGDNTTSVSIKADDSSKVEKAIKIIKSKVHDIIPKQKLSEITMCRNYKWCEFHNMMGHDTKDCRGLKEQSKKAFEFDIE